MIKPTILNLTMAGISSSESRNRYKLSTIG